MHKILVTGGCGYVGSKLVPRLLADGYHVTVLDIQWFGRGFLSEDDDNENQRVVQGDIRDIDLVKKCLEGQDAVIHLACVSNDTSCGLDEKLSTSINYEAFEPLVIAAKEAGVKRFIYCSTSSVYGISDALDVTEDHPLVPLTLYNKYKGMCEPILLKHQSPEFCCVIIRPATVCGYAPRMRFDLTVNVLTNHAYQTGKMTVYGGQQMRPNLHIDDMVDVYRLLLKVPDYKIAGQTFNVGKENMRVQDIAQLIQRVLHANFKKTAFIQFRAAADDRSYHINSDKIKHVLSYEPLRSVELAVHELCLKFEMGYWPDSMTNPIYTNVKQLIDYGYSAG